MRTTLIRGVLLPLLVVIVLAAQLAGQAVSSASIAGVVTDASGAVIPGATVQATQTATGVVRTTTTAANGSYSLNPLPIGPYRLEISREGFTKYVQEGITLQVGDNPIENVVLRVGSVNQQVVVQEAVNMVETQQVGVGEVINSQSIVDLPLNGRQATQLITLSGATAPETGGEMNSSKNYPTTTLSVAGGQSNGITFLLDGANYNDSFNNENLPLPMPDSLQEFKVETSALPAQYGYHAAAAVNAVTRQGTNSFHGTAFDFIRNGDLNARDYFASVRDQLKRNQFGGTIGGPIKHDRLFFFDGYQGTIIHSAPQTSSYTPTVNMLNGTNTCIHAPATISPVATYMLQYVPVSTDDAACGYVLYQHPSNSNEEQDASRVDVVINAKHSIFVRNFYTHYVLPSLLDKTPITAYNTTGINALTEGSPGDTDMVESAAFGDTYVISQNLVNQFRASLNRTTIIRTVPPIFNPTEAGVDMYSETSTYTNLGITGGFGLGNPASNPGHFNTTNPQASDDVLYMWKKHQFGVGFNYIHEMANTQNEQYPNGQFSFSGQFTGSGLGDFLAGDASAFGQGNYEVVRGRYNYIGAYFEDVWKLTQRFTVNYGIRWEPFFPTYTPNQQDLTFTMAGFVNNVYSTVYPNAPAGYAYPGDANFTPGRNSNYPDKKADLAPRLGIIWDPRGDGRTTIRASYGIFYDMPMMFNESRTALSAPWGVQISTNAFAGDFADPYGVLPADSAHAFAGGDPFPSLFHNTGPTAVFPPEVAMVYYPAKVDAPYINQYGLSVEKQIGNSWLAKAEYLGSTTIHQWAAQETDQSVYYPGTSTGVVGSCGGLATVPAAGSACSSTANTNQRRILYNLSASSIVPGTGRGSDVSTNGTLDDFGTASYSGLLLTLRHQMAHNFAFLGNYAYSHCISDPITHELYGDGSAYSNPLNRRFDRGNCQQDYRQLANLSGTFMSPKLGSSNLTRLVTGGWELAPILSMRSAGHFSVTTGGDTALTGITNDRAMLSGPPTIGHAVKGAAAGPVKWLNTSNFYSPATGTLSTNPAGKTGYVPDVYSIPGPDYFEFDAAVSRTFAVNHEKQNMEIRADIFNLPNRINFDNPTSTTISSGSSLGNITTDGGGVTGGAPRIIQVAAKINF